MSFADFKGIWKVRSASSGELVNDEIAIGGSETAVRILCSDNKTAHQFPTNAVYSCNERITISDGTNTYVITLAKGTPNEISCGPLDLPGPGSWTADDNVGGRGPYGPECK